MFRGHKVETYAAIKERLNDFLIVIAFASESPLVLDRFKELSRLHETVAPHLPLFPGDEIVTWDWLQRRTEIAPGLRGFSRRLVAEGFCSGTQL